MGRPIKSSVGIASMHQNDIANSVNGVTLRSMSMPSLTNLTVCSNAQACVNMREGAVSGARSNLLADAGGIGTLATRFAAMDAELGQRNAAVSGGGGRYAD
jgi:hypothetical protein